MRDWGGGREGGRREKRRKKGGREDRQTDGQMEGGSTKPGSTLFAKSGHLELEHRAQCLF